MAAEKYRSTFAANTHAMARTRLQPELQLQRIAHMRQLSATWREMPDELMLRAPAEGRWSAAETVEHMVEAHRLYIPKIDGALAQLPAGSWEHLNAGRLASFLNRGFLPKDGKLRYKMKTQEVFKPKRLVASAKPETWSEVLAAFAASLDHLEMSVKAARQKQVRHLRFNSAIGPVVRFNVAEAIEFILRHNERHLFQIDQTLAAVRTS